MDMKVQGSRSGKALGIGELYSLALAVLVLRRIDHRHHHHTKAQGSSSGIDHKIMPGS